VRFILRLTSHIPIYVPKSGGTVSICLVNFQWIVLAVLSAALMTVRASHTAPAAVLQEQIAPYLTPQRLAHIERGRTINLVSPGRGSPTVILTAGLENWPLPWRPVQSPLASERASAPGTALATALAAPARNRRTSSTPTEELERAL
jgi:hypothetical protein